MNNAPVRQQTRQPRRASNPEAALGILEQGPDLHCDVRFQPNPVDATEPDLAL